MNLTSYLDESGTHAGSPAIYVAGSLATAARWRKFELGLAALKRNYNFSVFHATEFKHRSGQFAKWSPEKCVALLHELTDLAGDLNHNLITTVAKDAHSDEVGR